jgi:hypothetical protein
MREAGSVYLLLLLLLGVSVCCLVVGIWVGFRDRWRGRVTETALSPVPDEDLLIFDRVTSRLSGLPRFDDPRALQAAQAEVMQAVGEQYGLSAADVEAIYWRVLRWTGGRSTLGDSAT